MTPVKCASGLETTTTDTVTPCHPGSRSVGWPSDNKAKLVVSTTDNLDPDQIDDIISAGKTTLTVLSLAKGAFGDGADVLAGGVAQALQTKDAFKKLGAALAESRYLWVRLTVTTCYTLCFADEGGSHTETHETSNTRWYSVDFGGAQGTTIIDDTPQEITDAVNKLTDRLQGSHPSLY